MKKLLLLFSLFIYTQFSEAQSLASLASTFHGPGDYTIKGDTTNIRVDTVIVEVVDTVYVVEKEIVEKPVRETTYVFNSYDNWSMYDVWGWNYWTSWNWNYYYGWNGSSIFWDPWFYGYPYYGYSYYRNPYRYRNYSYYDRHVRYNIIRSQNLITHNRTSPRVVRAKYESRTNQGRTRVDQNRTGRTNGRTTTIRIPASKKYVKSNTIRTRSVITPTPNRTSTTRYRNNSNATRYRTSSNSISTYNRTTTPNRSYNRTTNSNRSYNRATTPSYNQRSNTTRSYNSGTRSNYSRPSSPSARPSRSSSGSKPVVKRRQ